MAGFLIPRCDNCNRKAEVFKTVKMFGKDRLICPRCRWTLMHDIRRIPAMAEPAAAYGKEDPPDGLPDTTIMDR